MQKQEEAHVQLVKELHGRMLALKPQYDKEGPSLIQEITTFFAPAVHWFLEEMRNAKIRPWPPRQGPNPEALIICFATEWYATILACLRTITLEGSLVFEPKKRLGDDLWPTGLHEMPHIAVNGYFALSAKALSLIGSRARESAGLAPFPEAAARLIELLGYEVKR